MTAWYREQAEIQDLVSAYRRHEALEQELTDTRELIAMEDDAEMTEMADLEIAGIEGEMEQLYEKTGQSEQYLEILKKVQPEP